MNIMYESKVERNIDMYEVLLSVLNSLKQSKNITESVKRLLVKYYLEDNNNVNVDSFVKYYYNTNIYKENTKVSVYNLILNNPGIDLNEVLVVNQDFKKCIEELIFCNLFIKDNKCYIR